MTIANARGVMHLVMRIAMHPDARRVTGEAQDWKDELSVMQNLFAQPRAESQP